MKSSIIFTIILSNMLLMYMTGRGRVFHSTMKKNGVIGLGRAENLRRPPQILATAGTSG